MKNLKIPEVRECRESVPLKVVMKEVLMHLHCKGVLGKSTTQKVYNFLKLKDS